MRLLARAGRRQDIATPRRRDVDQLTERPRRCSASHAPQSTRAHPPRARRRRRARAHSSRCPPRPRRARRGLHPLRHRRARRPGLRRTRCARAAQRRSRHASCPSAAICPMRGIVRRSASECKRRDVRGAMDASGRRAPRSQCSYSVERVDERIHAGVHAGRVRYQIQTCIVTRAGCQKLNAEPDVGLVVGHPSWLASGTNVPSL